MEITASYIKSLYYDLRSIREEASKFVDECEKLKNKNQHYRQRTSDTDEIVFDLYRNDIVWSYERNTACHCHPEMETVENRYPIDDFVKWAKEKEITIEPYEENE